MLPDPRAVNPASLISCCCVRIVSLVPSATEMLFALGLGDEVTAVTHECDHPAAALELPKVTRDLIGPGLEPGEIDRAVRELTEQGKAIYALDEAAAARAAARPDRHAGAVRGLRGLLRRRRRGGAADRARAEGDLARPAHARRGARRRAHARRRRPTPRTPASTSSRTPPRRIDKVRLAVRGQAPVRVAAIEWLDPVFVAGHWTPQLIEYAGGVDVLGLPGEHSEVRTLGGGRRRPARGRRRDAVRLRRRARARGGRRRSPDELAAIGAERVVAVDAAAYFSRPGPRLVDGLELLAHILHPDRVPEAPGRGARGRALEQPDLRRAPRSTWRRARSAPIATQASIGSTGDSAARPRG